jgi:transposase
MMGQAVDQQDRLFYEFNLDERVPATHLLRRIDAVLDLSWLRGELKPYYSHTGCPSIDPELMIRMLLVGYCYSVRSERRLCQEVELNLAYRWFCRFGLEDKVPNHSTFSVNRHGRFREADVLRQVFESVVCHCMAARLVGGEGFAVDASVIEADASRFQRIEGAKIDWSEQQLARHAIKEYVTALETENSPLNPDKLPKALSPTDPAAAWTTRGRNHRSQTDREIIWRSEKPPVHDTAAAARPNRGQRRVPADCHGSEFEKTGGTACHSAAESRRRLIK